MPESIWLRTSFLLSNIEDCIKDDLATTDACALPVIAVYTLSELYRKDGQRSSDLVIAVGNMTTSFSWVVNKLIAEGIVERRDNLNDLRSPLVFLTAKGKQLETVIGNALGNVEVKYGGG